MPKILLKKKTLRLCKGLTSREFSCRCSYDACRSTIVSKRLIKAYEAFRILVGVALRINSGFRCIQHNFDEDGSARSRHTTGEAIDISLKTMDHLSHEEIKTLAQQAGFTFIKFYKTFIHLDVR